MAVHRVALLQAGLTLEGLDGLVVLGRAVAGREVSRRDAAVVDGDGEDGGQGRGEGGELHLRFLGVIL